MFCKKCGANLTENDQFCKNCGEKVVNETINNSNINNNSNSNGNSNSNDISSEPIISMTPMEVNNVSSIDNSSNETPVMVNDNISNDINSNNMNSMNNNSNMNNNVNTSNNSNNTKPGNLKTILIIAGVVVALILVFVIGFFNGKSTGNSGEPSSNGGSGDPATPVSNTSTYKVSFGGFTFEIPDTLTYEVQSNSLLFGNDTWAASLMMQQGDFNTLKSNRSKMKSKIESAGYTAKNAELKTINKREYITMEVSYSGENVIYVYTKGNNSYVFGVALYNIDNTYDYEPINEITSIFDSAVYSGSSMSVKSKNKFDANKEISSLLK